LSKSIKLIKKKLVDDIDKTTYGIKPPRPVGDQSPGSVILVNDGPD